MWLSQTTGDSGEWAEGGSCKLGGGSGGGSERGKRKGAGT